MLARQSPEKCVLLLYIAGMTPVARRALDNIGAICAEHLAGNYSLEVVDLLQCPECAGSRQIFAVPTLVRQTPLPLRKIIGDLANWAQVLDGLELREAQ